MPCGCKKTGPQYAVIAASGKTVYVSPNKDTADSVSNRYPNSKVELLPA